MADREPGGPAPTDVRRRLLLAGTTLVLLAGCAGSPSPTTPIPSAAAASIPSSAGASGGGVLGPTKGAGTRAADHGEVPPGIVEGNLGVKDQVGDGSRLIVGAAEIDGPPGWVVVQVDVNGRPGPVVGLVPRASGMHDDSVTVPLSSPRRTGVLWVSLHIDAGKYGRYESPGPDVPLTSPGITLSRRVVLTVPAKRRG